MRVLLAAQSFDVRYWFEGALSRSGRQYAVHWVSNAEDALRSLSAGNIDLAVVEAELEGAKGLEVIRHELMRGFGVPIIAMLSQPDDALEMTALRAGATSILVRGDESPGSIDRSVRVAIERGRLGRAVSLAPTRLSLVDDPTLFDHVDLARARAKRRQSGFAVVAVRFEIDPADLARVAEAPMVFYGSVFDRLAEVTGSTELLMRTAEQEVIAVVEGLYDQRTVASVGDRFLAALGEELSLGEASIRLRPRLGVALFPDHGQKSQPLVQLAREALQRANHGASERVQIHGAVPGSRAQRVAEIRRLLPLAVSRNELFLVYQPQVRISTGDVVGVEALLRWKSPDLGMVSPAEFVPIAEELGLIVEIGARTMREACVQAKRWQDDGARIRVGVNVSARQFADGTLDSVVRSALDQSGLDASLLEIEITEGVLLENTTDARPLLDAMRAEGVLIAVDDFGTGYSSLSYVKRLPMDVIKIDREFVRGLPLDQQNCAISSAIVALARSLELEVIAEGVETGAEEEFLRSLGCDIVQGFLHAKPMTVEDFDRWRTGRRISMVEMRRSIKPKSGAAEQ